MARRCHCMLCTAGKKVVVGNGELLSLVIYGKTSGGHSTQKTLGIKHKSN